MSVVLIADNDRSVSGLLTEVLVRSDVKVVNVYDGPAASAMARDPAVRVMVCDLDMPGGSGLDVLESLIDLGCPPLVVVVSGYLDSEVRARLSRLPFVRDVMSKPFDLLAFATRVQSLLTHAASMAPPALGSDLAAGGSA